MLVVGECYSERSSKIAVGASGRPLTPFDGPGGQRIAKLIGCSLEDFLDIFERVNLFEDYVKRWDKVAARKRALAIREEHASDTIIMMGRRVEYAFCPHSERAEPRDYFSKITVNGAEYVVAPHPSGLSHWWNDIENVSSAISFWRITYRELIHGNIQD